MVGAKTVIVLGLVCFAACASAQETTPFEDALPAAAADGFETGSYLVNGTGVVYDANSVVFFLNGTAVGTVPNPKAPGPGVDDPHTHEEFGLPDHEDPLLGKKEKSPPTPSPEVSDEMFDDILLKLKEGPNPLYNVVVGRKLLR